MGEFPKRRLLGGEFHLYIWPVLTLLRGNPVVKDAHFCGCRGQGRLVQRERPNPNARI